MIMVEHMGRFRKRARARVAKTADFKTFFISQSQIPGCDDKGISRVQRFDRESAAAKGLMIPQSDP